MDTDPNLQAQNIHMTMLEHYFTVHHVFPSQKLLIYNSFNILFKDLINSRKINKHQGNM